MNFDLRNYLNEKMDDLENQIKNKKSELLLLCEERQKISVIQKALLSHNIHDPETDSTMRDTNKKIEVIQKIIEDLTKKLNALIHYYRTIEDVDLLNAEKNAIEKEYPIIYM